MDELLNKRVVITLKTGGGVEGIPVMWTGEKVIITYPDNNNYTIIFNPSESIMMVSVFVESEEHNIDSNDIVEPPEPKLDHFEPNPELRALKLADLHIKKNDAIKEQLRNHFKGHTPGTPQVTVYDTPNFQK